MINIETNINSKEASQMSVLPSGMNLRLITSYHDETGVQFKAVNSNLKYLTSHQNKVWTDNFTFVAITTNCIYFLFLKDITDTW